MTPQKRNPKGLGGIYARKDGKFRAQVPIGKGPNGKTRYVSKTCGSKTEALRALKKLTQQLANDQLVIGPQVTLRKFAEEVLFDHSERWKPSVADGYYRCLLLYVFPVMGGKRVSDITSREIGQLLDKVRVSRSASTVNNIRTALSAVFRLALLQDLVRTNPVRNTEKARRSQFEKTLVMEPWTLKEVAQVREAFRGSHIEAFVLLKLSTGMRLSELRGLSWSAINFEEGTIFVHTTYKEFSQKLRDGSTVNRGTFATPKTEAGFRTIRVFQPMLDILQLHRASLELVRAEHGGDGWEKYDFVFPNRNGGAFSQKNVRSEYRRTLESADIRYIRLHDIRHTFATLCIEDDPANIAPVSRTLGHASLAITFDRYGRRSDVGHHSTLAMSRIVYPNMDPGPKALQLGAGPDSLPIWNRSFFERP